jgi:microcystin-dependent protein
MGGASANVITAESADNIGTFDGAETKPIALANLPEHKHDLRDSTRQQFYAIADVVGTPTDDNVQIYDAPTGTGLGQALSNSGGVITNVGLGAPFNVMPPTITLNYIIYTGRA